jgi:NADPH:quinone reductase-like Zn-dependent oxidoreductase
MRAIVRAKYGSPDVLHLEEFERPIPKANEALVKVLASSLNAADLEDLRGNPFVRIGAARKPRHSILGSDIAGRVEAVGMNVREFRPGDEIWGDLSATSGYGTFVEYVCVPEKALRLKPAGMTFEQAAAIPTAAVVAMQNLRAARPSAPGFFLSGEGQIQPGQKVLINGAGGGVGTFAIQIAKSFGAKVTGVDSARKLDMLQSIGADHVIDYAREDFTKSGQRYDLILDIVCNRSILSCRRALSHRGTYVIVGGSTPAILQALLLGPLITNIGRKKMGLAPWRPNRKEDLDSLKALFEAGKVVPVIDRRYPLSEVPEALRYLAGGRQLGKIVITMENGGEAYRGARS